MFPRIVRNTNRHEHSREQGPQTDRKTIGYSGRLSFIDHYGSYRCDAAVRPDLGEPTCSRRRQKSESRGLLWLDLGQRPPIGIAAQLQRMKRADFQHSFALDNMSLDPASRYLEGDRMYFECALCGEVIASRPIEAAECWCGNLAVDANSGTLNPRHGHGTVLVFHARPRRA
jgi:hypothetical protein